jgi:hypothetical protein
MNHDRRWQHEESRHLLRSMSHDAASFTEGCESHQDFSIIRKDLLALSHHHPHIIILFWRHCAAPNTASHLAWMNTKRKRTINQLILFLFAGIAQQLLSSTTSLPVYNYFLPCWEMQKEDIQDTDSRYRHLLIDWMVDWLIVDCLISYSFIFPPLIHPLFKNRLWASY